MVTEADAGYVERLVPGWRASTVILGLISMISIAYGAAFGAGLGWGVFAGLSILIGFVVYRTAPAITVGPAGLRAGAALLPWACVGDVRELDRDALRLLRGPAGDARTYLVLRPWAASGGIRVEVVDPQDPHPVWLISSRHPKALARAIASRHQAG